MSRTNGNGNGNRATATATATAATAAGTGAGGGVLAAGASYLYAIRQEISDRFDKLYQGQRAIAQQTGRRLDVMADSLTVSCNDITQEDAKSLEEISIPWHHYEALAKLYASDRARFHVLLKAAEKFKKMRQTKSTTYRDHLEAVCGGGGAATELH